MHRMPKSFAPTRRDMLRLGALALAPACHAHPRLFGRAEDPPESPKQPNVLVLISDQHRFDVAGFAGDGNAHTPALDRLAARGSVLEQVYCQAPLCLPARQSLLTGRYAHEHSSFTNVRRFPDGQRSLPLAFREAGYKTALIGKAHCDVAGFDSAVDMPEMFSAFQGEHPDGVRPGDYAVDEARGRPKIAVCNPGNLPARAEGGPEAHQVDRDIANRGRDWLAAQDGERPFFLWVSFLSPHPPLFPPEAWMDLFRDVDLPLLGTATQVEVETLARFDAMRRRNSGILAGERLLGVARSYYASVAWMDHCLGDVLAQAEKLSPDRETIVLYTSDHGEMLGEHGVLNKNIFYEGAVRVPAILSAPGQLPASKRLPRVVQHIDLSATLLDLAGIAEPTSGRSLRGVLTDPAAEWEDLARAELYAGSALPAAKVGQFRTVPKGEIAQMVRVGRYKSFRYERGHDVLFDLQEDPGELVDRAQDPELQELRAELVARMDTHLPEHVRVLTDRR
ncbi:MAG: arylsulfatase [Chlamydiales bacterium]|jgi:arylsulfatase